MKSTTKDVDRGEVRFILNTDRLNQLRIANGITDEKELAGVIGISAQTLWRVSQKGETPSNVVMAKIASTFPQVAFANLFTLKMVS